MFAFIAVSKETQKIPGNIPDIWIDAILASW